MVFYKNNAYPEVNLHDCNFQIKTVDNKKHEKMGTLTQNKGPMKTI